jgi:hypothetical protein
MTDGQKTIIAALMAILLSCVIAGLISTLTGCKTTYTPIAEDRLKDYPECVFALNTFKAYESINEKSGVVSAGTLCLNAIKRQRCVREVWNNKDDDGYWKANWKDPEGVRNFESCMVKP